MSFIDPACAIPGCYQRSTSAVSIPRRPGVSESVRLCRVHAEAYARGEFELRLAGEAPRSPLPLPEREHLAGEAAAKTAVPRRGPEAHRGRARDALAYVAAHPGCTTREVQEKVFGLAGPRHNGKAGTTLSQQKSLNHVRGEYGEDGLLRWFPVSIERAEEAA